MDVINIKGLTLQSEVQSIDLVDITGMHHTYIFDLVNFSNGIVIWNWFLTHAAHNYREEDNSCRMYFMYRELTI